MCSINCIRWGVKHLSKKEIKGKRICEVGSLDVNGSLRYLVEPYEPVEYVGVDIVKGPGVDIICPAEDLVQKFGKESFDMVISTATLEHIEDWKRAFSNIKNICKPEGIIIIIVPSKWPYHEYPHDYWRFKKEDILNIFSDCSILELYEDPNENSYVYAKIKKPSRFNEKNLTGYKLFSIVANKRVAKIEDKYFQSFYFKSLILKNKLEKFKQKIICILRGILYFI